MTAFDILDQLRRHGMHVRADGSQLIVAPSHALTYELRGLIRENKAALLAALTPPVEIGADTAHFRVAEGMRDFADDQRGGCLVACEYCAKFVSRPARAPDGWCKRFQVETWKRVPLGSTKNSKH